jgi:excisionase family DNA binding protein
MSSSDTYVASGTSPTTRQTQSHTTFEPLLSNAEAGKLLGLHGKTMDRLARAGKIPSFRIGKYWRYRRSELNSWLEAQRSGTLPTPELDSSAHKKERT